MTPVRWGVMGAANFAREQMARAIHLAEGADFAALATSSADKAAGFLAFAPGGQAEMTVLALIAGADLAFVIAHHVLRIITVIIGAPIAARGFSPGPATSFWSRLPSLARPGPKA